MKKKEKQIQFSKQYLAERGYEYDNLNFEQKKIVNNFLRSRGITVYSILIVFIALIVLGFTTYQGIRMLEDKTRFINSRDIIFYAVVAEDYERVFEPDDVRNIADNVMQVSFTNGVRLGVTFFLGAVAATALFQQKEKKKAIEAFFPNKTKIGSTDEEKSPS